ncbi:MAG: hypothetical protein ACO3YX_03595 [Candidatus Nanopelagicaceae bacterium]
MDSVKINNSKTLTLTLPSDPESNAVQVNLYHEFGDIVSSNTAATRSSSGVYTVTYGQESSGIYTLNSSGVHKAVFNYTVSGTEYTQSQYFNVYTPYTTEALFDAEFPELANSLVTSFDTYESKARNIIDTYCGQSFGYYDDKSITIDGNNHNILHLPVPIRSLRKVTVDPGESTEEIIHNYSDNTLLNIEKVRSNLSDSTYFIRFKADSEQPTRKFKEYSSYKIEGDFGWPYVPDNVDQASRLLIADLVTDDSAYRRHGIYSVDMDIIKYRTKDSFYESTGNIEVDTLLMDYTMFIMDYVV